MGNNEWGNYPCSALSTPWFVNYPSSAKSCDWLVQALGKGEAASELQPKSIGVGSVYGEQRTSCVLLEDMAWEYLGVPSWPSCGLVQ